MSCIIYRGRKALNKQFHKQAATFTGKLYIERQMASNNPEKYRLGPGEPALALQKHYHRKAFSYISKALKMDEVDTGLFYSLHHKATVI